MCSQSIGRQRAERRGPVGYRIGPVDGAGLFLDCSLAHELAEPIAVNNLNCGFVIACSTLQTHDSLASFLDAFAGWKIAEKYEDGLRQIAWQAGDTRMQLVWDEAANRVASRSITVRPVTRPLRYDSPLIRLADGQPPAIVPAERE